MTYVVAVLVTVVILYFLVKSPSPLKHGDLTSEKLRSLVEALYYRGFEGASAVVKHRREATALLIITKHIIADDNVVLRAHIPLDERKRPQQQLTAELARRYPTFNMGSTKSPAESNQMTGELGNDLDGAVRLIETVVKDVLQIDLQRDCQIYLENVSERFVRIGWSS